MNHVIACGWYALADANRSDAGHGLTLLFIRIGSEQVLNSCFLMVSCIREQYIGTARHQYVDKGVADARLSVGASAP